MSGKDKPVADYVFNSPHAREYRDKLVDLLFFMGTFYLINIFNLVEIRNILE